MQRARRARGIPSAASLRAWARAAARGGAAEITLRIVGAAEGRRLNRAYRGRDAATNVLSFDYGGRPRRGDVAICHDIVAREARAQGKSLRAHYAHMVVHGVLHLQGHDHARRAAAARMERLERRLLAGFGFADPYAPPARGPSRRAR